VCSDEGQGIPAKDLPRLFERFYRVDRARSRELGGTGLGLAIVRHIAMAHGGTATVQSTEGYGSTFCINLPSSPLSIHSAEPSDEDRNNQFLSRPNQRWIPGELQNGMALPV
jgi:signal transduction histidine kinase